MASEETPQAKPALWTPPKKLNQREQAMAWAMYLELFKIQAVKPFADWTPTKAYSECVQAAQAIYKIESGNTDG